MTLTRRTRTIVLAIPVIWYLVFLVLPLLNMGQTSLRDYSLLEGTSNYYTTVQFETLASDTYYSEAIVTTLRIAGLSAVTTTLLGACIAYLAWRQGGVLRRYLLVLCLAPLLISSVVRAYGWVAATGPNGLLSWITERLGLGALTVMYNEPSVILGFVHVLLPYGVILTLVSLEGIKPSVVKAAASVGAGELRRLRGVILPAAYSGMIAAVLLTFALASAAYSIPAILGGRTVRTASVVIYQEQQDFFNWSRAGALSIVLIAIVLITMLIYQAVGRRSQVPLAADDVDDDAAATVGEA